MNQKMECVFLNGNGHFFSAADLSGACPIESSVSIVVFRDLTGGRGVCHSDIGRCMLPELRTLVLSLKSGTCQCLRCLPQTVKVWGCPVLPCEAPTSTSGLTDSPPPTSPSTSGLANSPPPTTTTSPSKPSPPSTMMSPMLPPPSPPSIGRGKNRRRNVDDKSMRSIDDRSIDFIFSYLRF